MRPRAALLLSFALLAPALAGCFSTGAPAATVDPAEGGLLPSIYSLPFDVPDSGDASEPHVAIDPEGRIFITGPSGVGSGSPLWISEDGGATFTKVEPNAGRLGGGDTSVAIAADGTVYLTDLWVGSSTMLVSEDHGKTWWNSPVASQVPYYDREWNTVDAKGNAYHLGRTFTPGVAAWVSKSTDKGKTWIHAGTPWAHAKGGDANQGRQDGPFFTNPRTDAIAVVYSCATNAVCLSTSADEGRTWEPVVAAQSETSPRFIFPAAAADREGNYYVAYAARDESTGGTQVWLARSADGETFSDPIPVTSGPGTRLFPWIVAGDAGRVTLTWYGTDVAGDNNDEAAMKDAKWHVWAAQSLDALAETPTWRLDQVSPEPIKEGTVSTGGLGGDADRSLGDFFSIALDPQGMVHFAYVKSHGGDTNVVHAKQISGEPLYLTLLVGGSDAATNATLPAPGLPKLATG